MAKVAFLMVSLPAAPCPGPPALCIRAGGHILRAGGSLLPWAVRTRVFILRRGCEDGLCPWAARLGGPGRKERSYLSHQLGEVRAVSGRQPEERACAGVQRRAMAHYEDDACCRIKSSSRSRQAQRASFIRLGGPQNSWGKTTSWCPTALRGSGVE